MGDFGEGGLLVVMGVFLDVAQGAWTCPTCNAAEGGFPRTAIRSRTSQPKHQRNERPQRDPNNYHQDLGG